MTINNNTRQMLLLLGKMKLLSCIQFIQLLQEKAPKKKEYIKEIKWEVKVTVTFFLLFLDVIFFRTLRATPTTWFSHIMQNFYIFKANWIFSLDLQGFLIWERTAFLCKNVYFGNVYTLIMMEEMAIYLAGHFS